MRFVPSPLPPNSQLVRVCDGDGPEYSRLIVVTVEGDCLFLQGWLGFPLTVEQWRAGAAEHFKDAKRVLYWRFRNGKFVLVELML